MSLNTMFTEQGLPTQTLTHLVRLWLLRAFAFRGNSVGPEAETPIGNGRVGLRHPAVHAVHSSAALFAGFGTDMTAVIGHFGQASLFQGNSKPPQRVHLCVCSCPCLWVGFYAQLDTIAICNARCMTQKENLCYT